MSITLKSTSKLTSLKTACLVLGVNDGGKFTTEASNINKASQKLLEKIIKRDGFEGKLGSHCLINHVEGITAERILLIGLGKKNELSNSPKHALGKKLCKALNQAKINEAVIACDELSNKELVIKELATELLLQQYRYDETLSKKNKDKPLQKLGLVAKSNAKLKTAIAEGLAIGEGMNTARKLGDLPGNICTPSYLVKEARRISSGNKKLTVTVLEEKKLKELGMGAMLSVTAGTEEPAKLIVVKYQGAAKTKKPHVMVGKGVTFDSGGISLKPGARMDEMKYDMCGAASVMGTLRAVSKLDLNINFIGIIGAVENMPSGKATKPGDVVTSMSGQTIEVLNTDAEGRLVLCDALTYAEQFKPESLIDIATLTGACVVALGNHATGLYSNQDDFAEELLDAGLQVHDRAWHMPLWDEYNQQLKSKFADIANIGGPGGGSVTAACFLSRFTEKQRWAHLDIAGTAWTGGTKGASGRPVGLLTQYLINKS